MINLRSYQHEAIGKAIDFFKDDNPVPSLIVLPTAWGKSILTAYVAANIDWQDNLIVVQPTKELLEQNYNKFLALCGEEGAKEAGIYSASFGKKEIKKITYATIGSIKDIGTQFKALGYTKMLIDEAHLYPRSTQSMLGQFLKDSGIRQVLGITATPLKLEAFSEKQGDRFEKWSELIMLTNPCPSGTFFKKILHVGQIQEMTAQKFWSPLEYEVLPFDPTDLRINTSGNEYTENSIEETYKLNNVRANIYGALDYHSERRHCMVFVPSVEEAQILAKEYPKSAVVYGQMSKKDRANIINGFKKGEIRVIYNVNVLSTGFDYPEIDMIILGFSTASVAKYYQILGRGVRIHPDKKDCLVVDMGGNVDKFGKVEDIFFEHTNRWRMYGTGGKLLSGLPITCVGTMTRDDVARMYSLTNSIETFPFGKHRGKKVDEVPMGYRMWFLRNRQDADLELLDKIRLTIESYTRDTRDEPPLVMMPDGQHAGKLMNEIPRGYLRWYYQAHEWNEFNDSLRRGIELAYGSVPPYFTPKAKSGVPSAL